MSIKFAKMHGLGNDFIVIDGINQSIKLTKNQVWCLSQRDTGIGFDQCLLIEKSSLKGVDFSYRIFNADGNEVGQCGNGARCLALFIKHYKLSDKNKVIVSTKTVQMTLEINKNETYSVSMPKPLFNPKDIPLKEHIIRKVYEAQLPNKEIVRFHTVNVGNPHAIVIVDNIKTAKVEYIGAYLSEHSLFPENANIGFAEVVDMSHIKLRVFERGVGETKACGSGAIAAAVIGRKFYDMNTSINVRLPGGDLLIEWPHIDSEIKLTGAACLVYEGQLMKNTCE